MSQPKLNIRTMPSGQPAAKAKFDRPLDTALPQPDRSLYLYVVANSYQDAIDYRMAHDLCPFTTRYVSCPDVLKGVERPRVVIVGQADAVPEAILDALVRKQAEITYG